MSTYEEEENHQTPAVKQVISQPLQSDYVFYTLSLILQTFNEGPTSWTPSPGAKSLI